MIRSMPANEKYRANYDVVFGKKALESSKFVKCFQCGKEVATRDAVRHALCECRGSKKDE